MAEATNIYASMTKLLHNLDAVRRFQEGRTWPPHAIYHATSRCQLSCRFCVYKARHKNMSIPWDAMIKSIQTFGKNGTRAVEHSGGEPTLYPQFSDMVHAIHDEGIKQGLLTNGMTLASVLPTDQLRIFTWIRVSLNAWEEGLPVPRVDIPNGVFLSGSYVWHEGSTPGMMAHAVDWCRQQKCQLRVVPDEWMPKAGHHIEECHRTIAAFGDTAFLVHRLDRQPPQGCYMAWFKPMIGWDSHVHACCYSTTYEWEHNIQPRYRVCHISELEQFYKEQPIRDLGHRCSNCLGWEQNNFLAAVRTDVTHPEFI